MGKIPSDNILFLQVEIMCSSIKYVLKVIIFSIFILVTGIEKGETLHLKSCPMGPRVTLTSLLWETLLRFLTNECFSIPKCLGIPLSREVVWKVGFWSWPRLPSLDACSRMLLGPPASVPGCRGRPGFYSERGLASSHSESYHIPHLAETRPAMIISVP